MPERPAGRAAGRGLGDEGDGGGWRRRGGGTNPGAGRI